MEQYSRLSETEITVMLQPSSTNLNLLLETLNWHPQYSVFSPKSLSKSCLPYRFTNAPLLCTAHSSNSSYLCAIWAVWVRHGGIQEVLLAGVFRRFENGRGWGVMVFVRWALQLWTSISWRLYSFIATNITRLRRKRSMLLPEEKKMARNSFYLFTYLPQTKLLKRLRGREIWKVVATDIYVSQMPLQNPPRSSVSSGKLLKNNRLESQKYFANLSFSINLRSERIVFISIISVVLDYTDMCLHRYNRALLS